MEGQSKILWDFLETAYRTGTLDESLTLIQSLTGEEEQDMSQQYADLEEWFLERNDFTSVDEAFEKIYMLIQGLTDDDTMEGIGILLSFVSPLIRTAVEKTEFDIALSAESQVDLKEKVVKVLNALKTMGSLGAKMYLASLGDKPAHQIGLSVGKSLNSLSDFINTVHTEDANAIPDFMSGVFNSMNGDAVGKMAETLTNGFLDQNPPLLKWTAATAVKRTKKRLLNR